MSSCDCSNGRRRLPPWLKRRIPAGSKGNEVSEMLRELKLTTVCDGAHCPNRCECFTRGTATFMILGEQCTRNCRFCAVPTTRKAAPPRPDEPQAVAEASARLGLEHVVITSVTRDDLDDGGAAHFAQTINEVRSRLPEAKIEVLTPDFQGNTRALDIVLNAHPDVFNHNVETTPRLYPNVRPQANFQQSLDVLSYVHEQAEKRGLKVFTKSGFMVGLGETSQEVVQLMQDLRSAKCDILTIGQYLAPSNSHFPVERFVEPAEFDAWKQEGMKMGYRAVASGPFVRSSYNAQEVFEQSDS